MALESRIHELNARHRDLDHEIEVEVRSPASDPIFITALKRQKLKLKEEIETLRRQGR
jgi:hypothetical protein